MAGRPLPPPLARRPLLTPSRYDKVKGKGAKNWASKCSRPNVEVFISLHVITLRLHFYLIVTIFFEEAKLTPSN